MVKNSTWFHGILLGFILGIACASFFDPGFSFSFLLFFISFVILFLLFLLRNSYLENHSIFVSERKKIFAIFIFLLCFSVGFARLQFSKVSEKNQTLSSFVLNKIEGEGVIVDEPDERENYMMYTVRIEKILSAKFPENLKEKVLVLSPLYPKMNYGDRVKVSGILSRPENFSNETGRTFDYVSYLAKDGIYFQIKNASVVFVRAGEGNFIKQKIFQFKKSFADKIGKIIPEPEASVSGGILLGTRSSVSKDLQESFRKAGVIHVLVLSGYNVTIVAESVMSALSFLPIMVSSFLGAVAIILFAVMTGSGATVVRASLMALLVIFGRTIGRNYNVTRALFVAGFLMVLQNPRILVFDVSFQLSFLATFGLVSVSPLLTPYFSFLSEKYKFREMVVSTISAQIFVLPLILFEMGELSTVSFLVNLLILPFIPMAMFLSFMAGMIGFLIPGVSIVFGWFAYFILFYIVQTVGFFASLPFASLKIPIFSFWIMVFVYAVYAWIIVRLSRKKNIAIKDKISTKQNRLFGGQDFV